MIKSLSQTIQPKGLTSNRLQKLYLNPSTDPKIKQYIHDKTSTFETLQNISVYGGCAWFVLHMLKNKFKVQMKTPIYAIMPFLFMYTVKFGGYYWIDFQLESQGCYEAIQNYE